MCSDCGELGLCWGLGSGRQAVWRLWCNLVGVVKLMVAQTRSCWVCDCKNLGRHAVWRLGKQSAGVILTVGGIELAVAVKRLLGFGLWLWARGIQLLSEWLGATVKKKNVSSSCLAA